MTISLAVLIPSLISLFAGFTIYVLSMKNKNLKDVNTQQMNNMSVAHKNDMENVNKRLDKLEKENEKVDNRLDAVEREKAVDKKELEGKIDMILVELGTKMNSVDREMKEVKRILNTIVNGLAKGKK